MLQRQQASAIVDARKLIVDGAVDAVISQFLCISPKAVRTIWCLSSAESYIKLFVLSRNDLIPLLIICISWLV